MNQTSLSSETLLFNTPLEIGLRCIVILDELKDQKIDLQRLIYFDYLVIHYGDVETEYESLHPPTPHRSGEILVKRDLVNEGLLLMISKKLVEVEYEASGIFFKASTYCTPFLDHFESQYLLQLRENAKIMAMKFSTYTKDELKKYMTDNLDRWGGEFNKESLFRGN
ncbi:hypothetical protein PGRAT_23275 [Paenibacillus graminis]|uniref:Threonine transporter n=2 Tax=Paenibacillus graminis TaxID=189425 RepID=A0A089MD02_9BACL|nr:hypothetical protein PGRAT_23275 [Paenibacillus graminis]